MKWLKSWSTRPDLGVGDGERLLAWAHAEISEDGETGGEVVIGGTRDALYFPQRLAWEQVKAADWDQDSGLLRVSELGVWGERRAIHEFTISDPGRLLELVRERITASVVLQRHVPILGKRGVRVIARRPPGRSAEVSWFFEYDQGVDPEDPVVAQAADEALAIAQLDLSPS